MDGVTLLKTKKAPRKGGALFHIEIRERYLFQCSCLVEATELPLLWIILLIVGCNLGPPLDCSVPIRTRQPPHTAGFISFDRLAFQPLPAWPYPCMTLRALVAG